MSNWFDKWIAKKVRRAWEESTDVQHKISAKEKYALSTGMNMAGAQIKGSGSNELDSHPDLHFRMYRAENGYAMEVRHYDKRTERHTINLHLITDDQDLGQAISHIITLESLRVK
jgi:hypothetical protein